jgi:hypothetical protein
VTRTIPDPKSVGLIRRENENVRDRVGHIIRSPPSSDTILTLPTVPWLLALALAIQYSLGTRNARVINGCAGVASFIALIATEDVLIE